MLVAHSSHRVNAKHSSACDKHFLNSRAYFVHSESQGIPLNFDSLLGLQPIKVSYFRYNSHVFDEDGKKIGVGETMYPDSNLGKLAEMHGGKPHLKMFNKSQEQQWQSIDRAIKSVRCTSHSEHPS